MVWWNTKDMRNRELEDRIKNGNDDMTLRCNTKKTQTTKTNIFKQGKRWENEREH